MFKQTKHLSFAINGQSIDRLFAGILLVASIICALVLRTMVDNTSAVLDTTLTPGESSGCEFTGTTISSHSASIELGGYEEDFGSTRITTVCPNSVDHQVYAVGFSNDTEGNTNLINSTNNNLVISTGIETGNISNWSMKISKDNDSYVPSNLSIENSFDNNHIVPDESTLISSYTGGTDSSVGSSIMTTYSARSSNTQVKGEYTGKVKYTLTATMTYSVTIKTTEGIDKVTLNGVECTSADGCVVTGLISGQSYTLEVTPSSGYEFTGWNSYDNGTIGDETVTSTTYTIGDDNEVLLPEAERLAALLDTGDNVNAKMKKIANNTSNAHYSTVDNKIKAIRRANTPPSDFTATTENTISLSASKVPIYIFFDNTNDEGIMYYFTENDSQIIANSNCNVTFYEMRSLADITGVADWDTENVTGMSYMFYNCTSLTDITGLSNWDTAKVTYMSYMFYNTKITSLDALAPNKNNNPNIWNTGNVTSMSDMFQDCSSLTNIAGLSDWDTTNVTSMSFMFYNTGITSLDALVPNKNNNPNIWNTGNVKEMHSMFKNCSSLTDITGLSNWDTAKVTEMSYMFYSTTITSLDALIPNKNNNPNIWNTGNVTSMNSVFYGCTSLTDITGLSNWDTSNVTNMTGAFRECSSLTNITGLSNWNTAKVTSMSTMFYGTKITSLDALAPNKNNNPNIWNTSNVTDISYMFYECKSLTDITGLSDWDTTEVTSMKYTFYKNKIASLDALAPNKNNSPNIWNTGNVKNMDSIFSGCESLIDITGISNWDTSKVTDMSSMFHNTKITTLDALVPNKNNNPNIWNTGNVTSIKAIFANCSSLVDIIGVSNWDTAKVTDMSYAFFSSSSITDITGIANWDVNRVYAVVGDTSTSNHFYQIFKGVPSTTTSGFSFTNRAGTIDSNGTYVTSS